MMKVKDNGTVVLERKEVESLHILQGTIDSLQSELDILNGNTTSFSSEESKSALAWLKK